MKGSARRRDAGFTLLEVLVALVVLGFLMVGLSGGVRLGVQGWDRQAASVGADAELDAVDRALRRLVAGAFPGDTIHPAGVAGTANELELTTALPLAVSGGEGDVAVLIVGTTLVMRWRPAPPGTPVGSPPPAQQAELLRGVAGVRFGYLGPSGWQASWDQTQAPALVRIAILFPPGDPAGRHWPAIVAAPARDREVGAPR